MSARLEIIHQSPAGEARARPLLFVHGAFTAAWQWQPHYLPWFASQGWQCSAFSFSGHGASAGREQLDTLGVRDYVNDLAEVIAAMPVTPLVIAHSMGGFVLQKYLEHHDLPGAVLLGSVPPHGLNISILNLMFSRPDVMGDLLRILGGAKPTPESVRYALFHQPVGEDIMAMCYSRMQPESKRALWDLCGFDLPHPLHMHRPPMLVLGASHDKLIPLHQVMPTGLTLGQRVEVLAEAGHATMLEPNWLAGASRIHDWLLAHC